MDHLFNPFDGVERPTDKELETVPANVRAYLQRLEAFIKHLRTSPLTAEMLAKAYWETTRRLENAEMRGKGVARPWAELPKVSRERMETCFALIIDRLHGVATKAVTPFADALRPPQYHELKEMLVAALADEKTRAALPAFLEEQVPKAIEPNSIAGVLVDFFAFVIDRHLAKQYRKVHHTIFGAEAEPPDEPSQEGKE